MDLLIALSLVSLNRLQPLAGHHWAICFDRSIVTGPIRPLEILEEFGMNYDGA
jgi:hypothetical protein